MYRCLKGGIAMTAITISREIGSQGDWIAEQTAQRLGYHLVNKHTLERIFQQRGFVDFEETYDMSGFWARFSPHRGELVTMLDRFIHALAAHGDVILVGRGGFTTLKDFADVLNVRIQAPILMRIEQVMGERNLTEIPVADELVREQDHIREDFLQTAYGHRWNTAGAFDLVIDTGKIPPKVAVNWLVESAQNLGEKKIKTQKLCRELEIDPDLAKTIEEVLSRELAI